MLPSPLQNKAKKAAKPVGGLYGLDAAPEEEEEQEEEQEEFGEAPRGNSRRVLQLLRSCCFVHPIG